MGTNRDNGHSDLVIKKCQRIAGLKALLKEWELSDNLDLDYIRGLKARLLSVKNQLKNMCGHDGSEGMDDCHGDVLRQRSIMISSLLSHYAHVQQCSKSMPLVLAIAALVLIAPAKANASPGDDAKAVAALDTQYQAAVKVNDIATMNRILADNFVLVTGRGAIATKADLLKEAREKQTIYERQEEEEGSQKVRVWGDTAVVTALLTIKGVREGKPIDYKLWFSDTYVRMPEGWRYVFGQASLPLPK